MKLHLAFLATALSGTSAFTTVQNGPRSITELNARQPIMAGNWKVCAFFDFLLEIINVHYIIIIIAPFIIFATNLNSNLFLLLTIKIR